MATTLYLLSTISSGVIPRTERSTTLPVGTFDDAGYSAKDLSETAGTSSTSHSNTSLAQTAQQSNYMGKWFSPRLEVSSIDANTWTVAFGGDESSGAANAFVRVSIYVLKSDDTVRGFIYDATADLGVEVSSTFQSVTVTGSAVSGVVSTDRVMVEGWFVATQSMASAYTQQFYFNTADTYISTPQNDLFTAAAVAHPRPLLTPNREAYQRASRW